jgi:hemerythrin
MKWEESYNIGFDAIDARRQELFDVIKELSFTSSANRKEKIVNALKLTAHYASQGFPIEEELMRDMLYPELVLHQQKHIELKKQVSRCLVSLKDERSCNFDDIIRFLLDWLEQHVLCDDLKYREYRLSTFKKQEDCLKEQELTAKKQIPLNKLAKLKYLFKEKLITIDDFKERKIKIFSAYLESKGLDKLKNSIADLEFFQANDNLTENEKWSAILEFLSSVNLNQSINDLEDVEDKLILLNSFYECELVAENEYLDYKDKILSQI